jgi:non-canonical (house-cleaning) NTP pyrophosphatase
MDLNIDINDKTEDVEKAAKSENVVETLKDVVNENDIKTTDVEKSSEPVELEEQFKSAIRRVQNARV